MTVSPSRAGRQQRIIELVGERLIRSQFELVEILAAEGIEVTQATLSRDLKEIGAERVRVGTDLVYAVPGEGGDRTARPAADPAEVEGDRKSVV